METIPYTYLIGWSHLDKWYYGVRFRKNCNPSDLWIKYFTSSDHVTDFIKEHGAPNLIKIRKTFTDSKSARLWEHKVLRRLNARDDDRFLNKTNGDGRFFNTGHTEETKKLLSEKLKGKVRTAEFKEHLSKLNKGKLSGEKNGMFGRAHSEETKKKIGDSRRGKATGFKGRTYEEIQKDSEKAALRKQQHSKLMKEISPFKGKTHSEETKQKMRDSHRVRSELSEEDRAARWGHHKGKPWTEARRAAQIARDINKGK